MWKHNGQVLTTGHDGVSSRNVEVEHEVRSRSSIRGGGGEIHNINRDLVGNESAIGSIVNSTEFVEGRTITRGTAETELPLVGVGSGEYDTRDLQLVLNSVIDSSTSGTPDF